MTTLVSPAHAQKVHPAAPYQASPVIKGVTFKDLQHAAQGSDLWPSTWADDDNLYTAYGDGSGFSNKGPTNLSMGYARLTGLPPNVMGANLVTDGHTFGQGGAGMKASGMLMVEGVLYMWVRNAVPKPGGGRSLGGCQLAWSTDHAAHWTWSKDYLEDIGYMSFLNFGKNYAGARDGYVYFYGTDGKDAYNAHDKLMLLRVAKNELKNKAAYEYFASMRDGAPVWTRDASQRGTVFTFNEGVSRHDVVYNPGVRRYVMTMRSRDSVNHFSLHDAPEPWGPWTTFYYEAVAGETAGAGPGESQHFPSKWISGDGKTMHMIHAGEDRFNVSRVTLQTSGVLPPAPDAGAQPMASVDGSADKPVGGKGEDAGLPPSMDGLSTGAMGGRAGQAGGSAGQSGGASSGVGGASGEPDPNEPSNEDDRDRTSGGCSVAAHGNTANEGLAAIIVLALVLAWRHRRFFARAGVLPHGLAVVLVLCGGRARADDPYPKSTAITDIVFDWTKAHELAPGSDNWPITWAADDEQYTSWGDGHGFVEGVVPSRVALGVAKISGAFPDYRQLDLWGGTASIGKGCGAFGGKSYGILAIDDSKLFMWMRQNGQNGGKGQARLAHSNDVGRSWCLSDWMFPESLPENKGFNTGTFLQFGKNYAGARDEYVYTYFIRGYGGIALKTPGFIDLARVPRDRILDQAAYEHFAGMGAGNTPRWTQDPQQRQHVFTTGALGVSWVLSATYNAGLRRYILSVEDTAFTNGRGGGNVMGFYDAPEPWGPWTTIKRIKDFPAWTCAFSNKWTSADGRRSVAILTPIDSWKAVPVQFVTAGDPPPPSGSGGAGGAGGGGAGGSAPNRPPIAAMETTLLGERTVVVEDKSTDPDRDALTSSWSFGDGRMATGYSVEHEYARAGTYTIELVVKDARGATANANETITVSKGAVKGGAGGEQGGAGGAVMQEPRGGEGGNSNDGGAGVDSTDGGSSSCAYGGRGGTASFAAAVAALLVARRRRRTRGQQ